MKSEKWLWRYSSSLREGCVASIECNSALTTEDGLCGRLGKRFPYRSNGDAVSGAKRSLVDCCGMITLGVFCCVIDS